jgi:single-strand DNA-binding protein
MPNLNKCLLAGHLGRDAEVNTTSSGFPIGKFSLATTYRRKKGDNWEEQTTWHNVVVLGETARRLQPFLTKGKAVFIEGRIENRSYDKDGQKRYVSEVIADSVQLLGGGSGAGTSPGGPPPVEAGETPVPDDDLPF